MHQIAARPPAENARRIVGQGLGILGVSRNPDACLDKFGIHVDPDMVVVHARLLASPKIAYRHNQVTPQNLASWNLVRVKFCVSAPLFEWDYIIFDSSVIDYGFPQKLIHQFEILGMGRPGPQTSGGIPGGTVTLGNEGMIDEAIRSALKRALKDPKTRPQILLIVVPEKDNLLYSRIKTLADLKYGILTVCVLAKNTELGAPYWANVAMKFNLKLGGINHIVDSPDLSCWKKTKTMIVGIDVAHPSGDSIDNAPSIAGVVASVDKDFARWPASVRINESRQEMVGALSEMMYERVEAYKQSNNQALPGQIIVYRDGTISILLLACVANSAQAFPRVNMISSCRMNGRRFAKEPQRLTARGRCQNLPSSSPARGIIRASIRPTRQTSLSKRGSMK